MNVSAIGKSIRDYIREADRPEDLAARYSDMPGGSSWMISTRVKRLDSIIDELRKNAFSPEIKIFGSAAIEGDDLPKDIDAFIDTSRMRLDREIFNAATRHLLDISRKYYGMFDPFILHNGRLFTRNPESTGWVRSSKQKEMVHSGKRGIPITLFDKNFSTIAYRALSEEELSFKDWIAKVEESRRDTILFEGYQIPAWMAKRYTPLELAMILGGH
jgi:hypothetical protein